MIRHHPAPEILVDYARGSLSTGEFLVVGCHLDVCATCRREARLWEEVGGALLDQSDAAPLEHRISAAVLARLDEGGASEKTERAHVPSYLERYDLPASLRKERLPGRRWVAPGIWFTPLGSETAANRRNYLVYARGGTVMPEHHHAGREFTLVLHGSFTDATGAFGAGDFAETNEQIVHSPAVARDCGCLCLVSSEAPMVLNSWPARVIQRMLGSPY